MEIEENFKPFEKVLVRDNESDLWEIEFFSQKTGKDNYPFRCLIDCFKFCIPFEGNEHLLGTRDNNDF